MPAQENADSGSSPHRGNDGEGDASAGAPAVRGGLPGRGHDGSSGGGSRAGKGGGSASDRWSQDADSALRLDSTAAWASFIRVGAGGGMDAAWPLCPAWRRRGRRWLGLQGKRAMGWINGSGPVRNEKGFWI
jgi:hypothetical protein